MTDVSLRDQLQSVVDDTETKTYPYVRRDKAVRARLLGETDDGHVLVETMHIVKREPVTNMRTMTADYFNNNYWEGSS